MASATQPAGGQRRWPTEGASWRRLERSHATRRHRRRGGDGWPARQSQQAASIGGQKQQQAGAGRSGVGRLNGGRAGVRPRRRGPGSGQGGFRTREPVGGAKLSGGAPSEVPTVAGRQGLEASSGRVAGQLGGRWRLTIAKEAGRCCSGRTHGEDGSVNPGDSAC